MATRSRQLTGFGFVIGIVGLFVVASMSAPGSARAEVAGTSRVALVDTERLWEAGGIAAYAAAHARLEAERSGFTVAEHPGDPAPAFEIPKGISEEQRKRLQEIIDESRRRNAHKQAWTAREEEVLEPIRADVLRALERYARARGIGLVLDRAELGSAPLVVAAGVDITDPFIKDYNASTKLQVKPAPVPAKPAPAPAKPAATPAKPAPAKPAPAKPAAAPAKPAVR